MKQILPYLAVLVASIGGSVYVTDRVDSNRATQQTQRYNDLVGICERGILDRLDTIHVRSIQAAGDGAIAADPFQSTKTRAARGVQAAAEWASVRDQRTRVDPAHGGTLDCKTRFHR